MTYDDIRATETPLNPKYILSSSLFRRLISHLWKWNFRAYRGKLRTASAELGWSLQRVMSLLYEGKNGTSVVSEAGAKQIAEMLRRHGDISHGMAREWVEYAALREKAERYTPQGFCVVRERDGKGSVPRRGGRIEVSHKRKCEIESARVRKANAKTRRALKEGKIS